MGDKPIIAISVGDPAGIGPEISLKAALDPSVRAMARPLLVGDPGVIERHAGARKVITGGAAQIDWLKGTLVNWLHELFAGPFDAAYVARRWRVGWRHVEIGLEQVYANVALSRLRTALMRLLEQAWPGQPQALPAVVRSLRPHARVT